MLLLSLCIYIYIYICIDIIECDLGTDMCNENATCQNTIGSYDCTCNAGFIGNGVECIGEYPWSGLSCRVILWNMCTYYYMIVLTIISNTDIDECDLETHDCAHNCSNTVGSFVCSCRDGYQLDNDQMNCTGTIIINILIYILRNLDELDAIYIHVTLHTFSSLLL